MSIIQSILTRFGVTLPVDNLAIVESVRTGSLIRAIMLTETMNPARGIADLNASGEFDDRIYTHKPDQPINIKDDVYYERADAVVYRFTEDECYLHRLFDQSEDRALVAFIEQHYTVHTTVDLFSETNNNLRAAFKHFNIPTVHLDYNDKYVVYMIQSGNLLRCLAYLNSYYQDRLQDFLAKESKHSDYTRLGLALMISEYLPDIKVMYTVPGELPTEYSEGMYHGTGLIVREGKLRVYNREDMSVCGIEIIDIYDIMSKQTLLKRSGVFCRNVGPDMRGFRFVIPNTQNNPYYETIVDQRHMLEAMQVIDREGVDNWKDVAAHLWGTV